MPSILVNNANGGVDGQVVTAAGSGNQSGTAAQFVIIQNAATVSYDAAYSRRSGLCYKFTTLAAPAPSGLVMLQFNSFVDTTTLYARFYVYIDELPAASVRLCELMNDDGAVCFAVGIRSDGTIIVRDATDTLASQFTLRTPTKRWLRFEVACTSGVGSAQSTVKLYTEADSPHPAETRISTPTLTTQINGLPFSGARFGVGYPVQGFTLYMDDIALSDTGYLGPAKPGQIIPTEYHTTADFGVDGLDITRKNSGTDTNQYFSTVEINSPGEITYSNTTPMHGALSYRVQSSPLDQFTKFGWSGLSTTSLAVRLYVRFNSLPTASIRFVDITNHDSSLRPLRFVYTIAGKFLVQDLGESSWTSTSSIALDQWYRFEAHLVLGDTPSTGYVHAAFYIGDSPTPVESYTSNSVYLGSESFGRVVFGKLNAGGEMAGEYYIDSMAVKQSASGLIGPYTGVPSAIDYGDPGVIPHHGWGIGL